MKLVLYFLFSSLTAALPLKTPSPSEKKTICLNMIVKNESKAIQRCLESVKPFIDYWVIVDTGSTDGTQQLIQSCLQKIPGKLYQSPWVNFEHNRNEALSLARGKSNYILFLDADEHLIVSDPFTQTILKDDCYLVPVHQGNNIFYERILLIKDHLPWKWEGVLHETLCCLENHRRSTLQGVLNQSITADGGRSKDPLKYHQDAAILEEALKKDPSNSRYVFYLAQSYANAGQTELALKNYQKRATMGGWDQEVFWSLYTAAKLQYLLGHSKEDVARNLWSAFELRPSRAEPLLYLADLYTQQENHALAYLILKQALSIPLPHDGVFVDHSIYQWKLGLAFIQAAHRIRKYDEALHMIHQLLASPAVPSSIQSDLLLFSKIR